MLYLKNNQLTTCRRNRAAHVAGGLNLRSISWQPTGGDRELRRCRIWTYENQLTSVPAEIGQLTSLGVLTLKNNQLTSLPAEIGQLTSLGVLTLNNNQLTSMLAEIGQLTSLMELQLGCNKLASLPSEIGQLTSLQNLHLYGKQLTSDLAEIGSSVARHCTSGTTG